MFAALEGSGEDAIRLCIAPSIVRALFIILTPMVLNAPLPLDGDGDVFTAAYDRRQQT